MTDPDVPGPSDPYLREHLHWYTLKPSKNSYVVVNTRNLGYSLSLLISYISLLVQTCVKVKTLVHG